jgi:hypothetical protein
MNKIITLSIATIFLATSYASHSQNIEHQSPHHKIHWGYKGAIGPSHYSISSSTSFVNQYFVLVRSIDNWHAICCADVLSVSVSDNRRRIFSSSLVVLLML